MTEVRTVSSTGARKGVKPERPDLIPVGPLRQLALHYGVGAEKYTERDEAGNVTHEGGNNWRAGYEWSKSYAALQRHLLAFWGGEDIDPETKTSHLAAAAWHCFTLLEFTETHPEFDDRVKPKSALEKFSTFIEKEFEPTETELIIQPRTMTVEFKTLDRDPDIMATLFNVDARSIDQAIERGEARAEARQRQGFIGR